jgi:hypothetical protein
VADPHDVNKWADIKQRKAGHDDLAGSAVPSPPVPGPWADHDKAILDHMREILGGSLFDGCGQPDCFDCAEDRPSR